MDMTLKWPFVAIWLSYDDKHLAILAFDTSPKKKKGPIIDQSPVFRS
jgi:hypothetical protein